MKLFLVPFLFTFSVFSKTIPRISCDSELIPLSSHDLSSLTDVLNHVTPNTTEIKEEEHTPIDGREFDIDGREIGMQIGVGGNPDIDGKITRKRAWVISVLFPIKETHVGGVPTTIYAEARCHSLGKQPATAYTDNINVRCGPDLVADIKLTDWLSGYSRVGVVTSRFSYNGAPKGQINPKTGVEFRLYPNKTGFTGAAMGVGLKVKLNSDTVLFGEYTKYYVQQTDNPAYQFRGGWNYGIAKKFWLFQGEK